MFYRWDDDILSSVYDLGQYWAALSMEEKWLLTEMSATDLYQLMKHDQHWEILRTASESVSLVVFIFSYFALLTFIRLFRLINIYSVILPY